MRLTHHRTVGFGYLLISLIAVLIGTVLSLAMRLHLTWPAWPLPLHGPILPEEYLALVTLHGTLMLFFVLTVAPQSGFGNLILPSQIGASHMAFPRINAAAMLLTALALAVLIAAVFVPGGGPISGWTAYPPLSTTPLAGPGQGYGMDCWLASIALFAIASTASSINTLTTIVKLRCEGMTWQRLPLTVWGWFTAALLSITAFSVLLAALTLLFCDRHLHTAFFLPSQDLINGVLLQHHADGSPLLWLHLFWFFGHPEVYIAILPGMGLTSMVLANFARRRVFAYNLMIATTLLIGFLGIFVWGHHMFVAGLNPFAGSAFSISTIAIALPASAKVLSWLATLWRSRTLSRPVSPGPPRALPPAGRRALKGTGFSPSGGSSALQATESSTSQQGALAPEKAGSSAPPHTLKGTGFSPSGGSSALQATESSTSQQRALAPEKPGPSASTHALKGTGFSPSGGSSGLQATESSTSQQRALAPEKPGPSASTHALKGTGFSPSGGSSALQATESSTSQQRALAPEKAGPQNSNPSKIRYPGPLGSGLIDSPKEEGALAPGETPSRFPTPMLFALGFVSLFITGGLSGPILAQPILDEYLHNTFFVVAHFHLIMAMAGIFGLFCATYYWAPILFHRRLSEPLGKLHFWGTLLGAYSTFLPMHLTGLAGEPRHYAQLTGITPAASSLLQSTLPLQRHITLSALFLACAQLPFLLNLLLALRRPPGAAENPWQSTTLEWSPWAIASESKHPSEPTTLPGPTVYRQPCLYSQSGDTFLTQWDSTPTPEPEPE